MLVTVACVVAPVLGPTTYVSAPGRKPLSPGQAPGNDSSAACIVPWWTRLAS